jgi:diguanylate cyclase (GGDEF)-like protein
VGGALQEILQRGGGQTRYGSGVGRLLPPFLLLALYAGLLFDIPLRRPLPWFALSLVTTALYSFLCFARKRRDLLVETLLSGALILAGIIQLLSMQWLHILYLPFLISLALLYRPGIIIPLSLAVPALEARHFLKGNRIEESLLSLTAVGVAVTLSSVVSAIRKERDRLRGSLSKITEGAIEIDSGAAITISNESLLAHHLSSTNRANTELSEILSLAAHVLPADSVRLHTLKGNDLDLRCAAGEPQEAGDEEGLLRLCTGKRASVLSGKDPSGGVGPSAIATPVLNGSFVTGVLSARRSGAGRFGEQEIRALEMLSRQVARVLHAQRVNSHTTRQQAGMQILNQGSSSLVKSLKIEDVARNLIEMAHRIAPLSIALFVARGDRYELIHEVGFVAPEEKLVDFRNTLVATAIRSREPLYLSDLREHRLAPLPFRTAHSGSICVLPLVYEKDLLGVLVFLSRDTGALNPLQFEYLKVLGNQAVSALENVKLYAEIERMAVTDGLTGLHNHRHFQEKLTEEFGRLGRFSAPLSLLLVDIDFFKKVNDTCGHPAGDEILRRVAGMLKETVRSVDIAARYGGEEFAAILPGTDYEGARKIAERLRASVMEKTFPFEGRDLKVTVSIGAATCPSDAATKEDLIEKADRALYHAKRNGRNRCVLWREIATRDDNSTT